jgi:hypothetical protein
MPREGTLAGLLAFGNGLGLKQGEAPGNRTRNHRLKRPMLCQLS